ncbi:hypothetical protein RJT34_24201 [Clitoria ternatea]|uniref:Uncharacterized protein n=1 Tax=Clitoria ternatea TaxID=43366 RepID=A0AAN9FP72_CLITE
MDRDAFPPNQRSKRPNEMEIYLSSGAVSTISFPNHKLLAISASVISHCGKLRMFKSPNSVGIVDEEA